jgi:sulfite exporter TauE/SafE
MTAAILAGIVATSAIGSIHCLAMCGPLVGLAGGTRTMRLAATHSLGRLATYATLGMVAGLVGSAIDLAGRLGNLQRAATIVAGLVIVGWGVWTLVGHSKPRATPPQRSAFARGLVQIRTTRPGKRAYLMGMLTGLLPCGWLWAFVITAAGTGHPLSGALVMVAFWIGTVPAMVGLLAFAGPMIARVRARMPAVTAIALIAIGLGTLAFRWRDAGVVQVMAPHCHCHGAQS